jgi:hypothetical protein
LAKCTYRVRRDLGTATKKIEDVHTHRVFSPMLMLLKGLHDLLGTIPDVIQQLSLVAPLDILLFCLPHSLLEASKFKNTPEGVAGQALPKLVCQDKANHTKAFTARLQAFSLFLRLAGFCQILTPMPSGMCSEVCKCKFPSKPT